MNKAFSSKPKVRAITLTNKLKHNKSITTNSFCFFIIMKPPLFSCLSSSVANNGSLYGRFLFGPLPIDISLTVATVLRRSLLHSKATFTIVSAEIGGAYHEYASLPGIQESVLEILLNLGEIVLTSTQRNLISPHFRTSIGTSPFFFANISVSGPGIVTAKDINWPKGIFCVKPHLVICTLSSNETLTMRLKILCSLNKNKQSFYENEINLKNKPSLFGSAKAIVASSLSLRSSKSLSSKPRPTGDKGFESNSLRKDESPGRAIDNNSLPIVAYPKVFKIIPWATKSIKGFKRLKQRAIALYGHEQEKALQEVEHENQKHTKNLNTFNGMEIERNLKNLKVNKSQVLETKFQLNLCMKNVFVSSQENKQNFFTSNQKVQFFFFKLNKKGTTLIENQFIRIQKKQVISNKTKEKSIKGYAMIDKAISSNKILYMQTIESTQRLLTKSTGSLDSYSKSKEKAKKKEKEKALFFSSITNKETIFISNKSFVKINSLKSDKRKDLISKSQRYERRPGVGESMGSRSWQGTEKEQINQINQENQEKNQRKIENKIDIKKDLEKNITFCLFPRLFNDFTDPFFLKQESENNKDEDKDEDEEQVKSFISNKIKEKEKAKEIPNPKTKTKAYKNIYKKRRQTKANEFPRNSLSSWTRKSDKRLYEEEGKTYAFSPIGYPKALPLELRRLREGETTYPGHDDRNRLNSIRGARKDFELLVKSSSYPVEKVNFLIERDDELVGYRHRIILEVWTNGSISPRQALFESIGSIIKLIYNFREPLRNI